MIVSSVMDSHSLSYTQCGYQLEKIHGQEVMWEIDKTAKGWEKVSVGRLIRTGDSDSRKFRILKTLSKLLPGGNRL